MKHVAGTSPAAGAVWPQRDPGTMPERLGTDNYMRRALLTRLVERGSTSEASHLIVAALVGAMLWGSLVPSTLLSWLGAIVGLALLRMYVRRRVSRRSGTLTRAPRRLRLSIVAVAFAWGLGAFVVAPRLGEAKLMLLVAVFCGISAGATASLLGDPPAFLAYLAAMLVPLAGGVLRSGISYDHAIVVVLLAVFAIVLVGLYRRLQGVLVESLATARRLALSQAEAERERRFLDALVAAAPTPITVLDARGRVTRINPAFEHTFGYGTHEAVGREIDTLIVPLAQRSSAEDLSARVAAGGVVTVDEERRRKDGSVVYVRISAALVPGGDGEILVVYDDVSEAKLAEIRVRESEQRWFQMLEGLPVGIVVVDRAGAPLFANPVARTLLGDGAAAAPVDDHLAAAYHAYVAGTPRPYPADRLPVVRALRGKPARVDDVEIRRGDETINLDVMGSPITDGSGAVVYGVTAFHDITERYRRAEYARARSAVARVLAEAGPDDALPLTVLTAMGGSLGWDAGAFWRVDDEGGALRLSAFWHRPGLGADALYTVSQGLRLGPNEGVPGRIWRAGKPVWFEDFGAVSLPARAGAAAEADLHAALGVPLPVSGHVNGVLEFFGTVVRQPDPEFLATLESIGSLVGQALERHDAETARRRAEAQYRELVEVASDMVWRIDREGRLTFLNRAAEQIYGQRVDALLGRSFTELCDPEYLEHDRQAMAAVLAGGELIDHETVHRDAARAARHLSTSARPVRDETGTVVGVQGIARDIGARAAAREALRAARDAAEQAAAARSAFLANMSHEIRTPINGVLGMAELLLDGDLSTADRRSVEMIVSSGEALLGVINDILDFSKIEAQQLEIEATEFDLPSLVEATTRLLTPAAGAKGVELVLDIPDTVPQYVVGDPTRVRQVLTNLLGNAVKFTGEGEVVVQVTPVPESDRLRLSVRDTGPGIADDKMESIFEPFRQADPTTTRRHGGTGLGLSISRRLVALMGGTLVVESEVGHGSTFAFELPLPAAHHPDTPAPPRVDLAGVRVLVVDDNPTNRDVMERGLRRAGCYVDAVDSGAAALQALRDAAARRVPHALMVTDVFMPGMDGFDLVAAVRDDPSWHELPILMLSSAIRRGDSERSRTLGVSALLLKPVSRGDLADAAGAALGLAASATRAAAPHIAKVEGRHGLRILLAEDNPVNQEVAATMLRRRGDRVDVVSDGAEAVEAVHARENGEGAVYDIVLMDLQMPRMDGFAAAQAIRGLPHGTALPIVAVTANALHGERERCLGAGMTGYLAKPYKPHELFSAVDSAVAGSTTADSGVAHPPDRPPPGPPIAVDLAQFRAEMRSAGAEEAVDEILRVFVHDAPSKLDALTRAVAAADVPAMARAAHAFKSSAGTIHASRLAELLLRAETAAKSGDAAAVIDGLPAIRQAYDAVMDDLRPYA